MISPKEISNKKFEKSTLGGYKTDDVDQFLRDVAIDVSQIQKEKDDCEKKIDVLADKIREYMNDEDVIKQALLGAQRQGHQVIEDSQNIANKIIAEANEKSDKIISLTQVQLENEKISLAKMQKEVSDFKAKLLMLYKSHLDLITAMPDVDDAEVIAKVEEAVQESVTEEEKTEPVTDESKKHSYPFPLPSNNNEPRYSDLKFGHNK